MRTEVLLALAASAFTASASVAQRTAAAPAPGELRFSWRLMAYLARRPMWFVGILCMLAGFGCQLVALHFGELSLVEPVLASELLLVFGYLALRNRGQVHGRDWVAAVGMAASLGAFLYLAQPSGGVATVTGAQPWVIAGGAVALAVALAVVLSGVRRGAAAVPPARRAAFLAAAAGATWGLVAAIVKQLAGELGNSAGAVLTSWPPYALLAVGAAGMYIVSNAFQAGPLAASQPGLTVVEPLVATLLGVTMFGEHVRHGPGSLAGELVSAAVLTASVVLLSRSPMLSDGSGPRTPGPAAVRAGAPEPGAAPVGIGAGDTGGDAGPLR